MSDRIQLRGLRALGICGALPEEQARVQPIEVDLDLSLDLTAAAESDHLADTVDYGQVCAAIEHIIMNERFAMLERLAGRLADELLSDDRIDEVTVTVRKLRPPVPQQLGTAGVQLTRGRGA